jgi:hypothetical protein
MLKDLERKVATRPFTPEIVPQKLLKMSIWCCMWVCV